MKKEITVHTTFLVVFFFLTALINSYFDLTLIFFVLGGIVGTILPDIDHIIYVYFFAPQELTSQRVNFLMQRRQVWRTLVLMANTREQRTKLIFHTAFFQVIFFTLSFLVISSSSSVFGKGLVLAFSLHLLVDQLIDLLELEHLNTWFTSPLNLSLDKKQATFWWVVSLLVLFLIAYLM